MNKITKYFLVSCLIVGSIQSYRTQDLNHEFPSQKEKRISKAQQEINEKQQKIDSLYADIENIGDKIDTLKKQCPKNPITCIPSSVGMGAEKSNMAAKQLEIDKLKRDIRTIEDKYPQLKRKHEFKRKSDYYGPTN